MARITVEDCLEKVDNQYDLVLLAKERTVQLNAGSPMLVDEDNDKRTIISLREIGDGKINVKEIATNITGTVANPSKPSVKFPALDAPIITNKPKGIKNNPIFKTKFLDF